MHGHWTVGIFAAGVVVGMTAAAVGALFRAPAAFYSSSGFDRGHMIPYADVAKGVQGAGLDDVAVKKCTEETFLLSNISPQHPPFNRHVWSSVERFVRRAAEAYEDLIVVTGPAWVPEWNEEKQKWRVEYDVLGPPHSLSIDSPTSVSTLPLIHVPSHFFKCLLGTPVRHPSSSSSSRTPLHLACFFVPHVPNLPAGARLDDYRVDLETVQRVTGIELFPGLSRSEGHTPVEFVDMCSSGLLGCGVHVGSSTEGKRSRRRTDVGGGGADTNRRDGEQKIIEIE
ncbi:nuclease [Gonapodya sp. JEL0774]|nr:nuclease [Gonapodya sp. JEL0774]